ncbi:DUF2851 family protein [Catalinimonas niigatensis]|uniref:DUF2851 family protein n=1 Tax=Catalinimonas niigatensis TaxID=1397264 RepID=UPI002665B57E|nr:DUF2851 family protein [Catalinimonas niigatensis]WPP50896.1 DUF2851 family protein [Catalinimonas niigatensis]
MKEDLLQHIWQYQLFDKQNLQTTDGHTLNIIRLGIWNRESGPDFLQAQIKIDDMVWFGSIEIHIHASDWKQHKHHLNPAFDNVILHVVWEHPKTNLHHDGTKIPTLALKDRVDNLLLKKYDHLLHHDYSNQLACASYLTSIPSIHKFSVLEKAALKRLERKSAEVKLFWGNQQKDWQQTAFQWICRAYGFKVNAEAFATLGTRLPYQYLQAERDNFENIVALLFEVSGLIDTRLCSKKVINTAQHLRQKYAIDSYAMQKHEFRWSRLRPPNFPEVRLIQLAALLYKHANLMDILLHLQSFKSMLTLFDKTNDIIVSYNHEFPKAKVLGKESIYTIIINAIIPFRYAYGMHNADEQMKDQAVNLLQEIPGERNRFTKIFSQYNFPLSTALESQGVLEQYRFACQEKRCLECHIGAAIMKNRDLLVN